MTNFPNQREAPSATNSVTDRAPTEQKRPGATGKLHPFMIPGCRLTSMTSQCEGGRPLKIQVSESGPPTVSGSRPKPLLGVVPHGDPTTLSSEFSFLNGAITVSVEHKFGSATDGDLLQSVCAGQQFCTNHPVWTISDKGVQVASYKGPRSSYSFLPPGIDGTGFSYVFNAMWLKDIAPRVYQVSCCTCRGSAELETFEIHVYPNVESSATFNFGAPESKDALPSERPTTVFGLVEQIVNGMGEIVDTFQLNPAQFIEMPRGEIKITNKWEEEKSSPFAQWSGSFSVGLNPVIGLKFHETIVPALAIVQRIVPGWMRKYVNVDVYLELKGDITFKTSFDWHQRQGGKVQIHGDLGKALGGVVGIELGAEGWLGAGGSDPEGSAIYVTLHGNTSVELEGGVKVTDECEVEVEGKATWHALSVTGTVVLWHGWFGKHGGTWQVLPDATGDFSHAFFKHQSKEESEAGGTSH
jgi:hypothetical protein